MYDMDVHKRKVKAELTRRGIGSLMNNTKWRELIEEIKKLPFPPAYQRKDVMLAIPEPESINDDVWYWGDWDEGIHPFFSIEWIRIHPRYSQHVGQLLPKKVHVCSAELEQALQAIKQPYVKDAATIWIYGYR